MYGVGLVIKDIFRGIWDYFEYKNCKCRVAGVELVNKSYLRVSGVLFAVITSTQILQTSSAGNE